METDKTIDVPKNEIGPIIKYGWLRALLFLIASLIVTSIGSALGLIVVSVLFGVDLSEMFQDTSNIIKNLGVWSFMVVNLFGMLGLLFTAWNFRRFIDRKSFKSLGFAFREYKMDFIQGMLLGIGLISLGFFLLWLFGFLTIESLMFIPISILGYIFLFFIVAVNEEVMVRGYILNNLSESVNKYIALIITAVLFAIMHMANANISTVGFINIILAGILLGIYYIHKQNLWFPIGIHFTWNLFQGPVLGFEVSGEKTNSIITQNIQGNEILTGGEFGFEASLLATALMIIAIIVIHLQFKTKQ
jgi:membrane protease YdiL (CAAX protease family)